MPVHHVHMQQRAAAVEGLLRIARQLREVGRQYGWRQFNFHGRSPLLFSSRIIRCAASSRTPYSGGFHVLDGPALQRFPTLGFVRVGLLFSLLALRVKFFFFLPLL